MVSDGPATGNSWLPEGRGGGIFNAGGGAAAARHGCWFWTTRPSRATPRRGRTTTGIAGGIGAGGGIYNDLGATLTLQDGSQVTNNKP